MPREYNDDYTRQLQIQENPPEKRKVPFVPFEKIPPPIKIDLPLVPKIPAPKPEEYPQ